MTNEPNEPFFMATHTHDYTHRCLEFLDYGDIPGTAAKKRAYFDVYFCRHCLLTRAIARKLPGEYTSYDKPFEGATPMDANLIGDIKLG